MTYSWQTWHGPDKLEIVLKNMTWSWQTWSWQTWSWTYMTWPWQTWCWHSLNSILKKTYSQSWIDFQSCSAYALGSSGCFSVGFLVWASFSQSLLQNLTSLHLVLKMFLKPVWVGFKNIFTLCAICSIFWLLRGCCNVHSFYFERIPSLMSNPNYLFSFCFDETQQLIDSLQFDGFFP